MAKTNSRRCSTLRMTRTQYRELAEKTKAVGLGLNISSMERMGAWGTYSPWALQVCKDATEDDPQWDEKALINIASSINLEAFRAQGANRPEIDWALLEDHEVYRFIVEHEIGHRQDNFDNWEIMLIKDLDVRDDCHRRVRFVNEMLADRYAWSRIRPGEPLPLSENGKRLQEGAAYSLALMEKHAPRIRPCEPRWRMTPGPYNDVPAYMLGSPERAAFLGPRVSRALVEERTAYFREYNRTHRQPLF